MMHQIIGNRFIIYLFLLLLLGSINNHSLIRFYNNKVDSVYITGFEKDEMQDLQNNIVNLNLKNIF